MRGNTGEKRKAMNITELQQSYASHPNVEGVQASER